MSPFFVGDRSSTMNQVSDKLTRLLEPVVTGLGYEMVGIEWSADTRGRRILRVYIDTEDGVTVDDCEKVSHQIGALLDVENLVSGTYMLEISSPGLDRPLFSLEHFQRFTGSAVRLQLFQPYAGQRRFRGIIEGVTDDTVLVRTPDGEVVPLPFELIEKARLVPDYKAIMKGKSR